MKKKVDTMGWYHGVLSLDGENGIFICGDGVITRDDNMDANMSDILVQYNTIEC
jgi:hypothetical protein